MGASMAPTAAARITAAISASVRVKPRLVLHIGCTLTIVPGGVWDDLQRLRLVDPAGGIVRLALRRHRAPIGHDQDGVHPVQRVDWHLLDVWPQAIGGRRGNEVTEFVG